MSKVDWSLAPEDATHYLPDSDMDYECWVKPGYSMRLYTQKEWHADKAVNKDIRHGRAIERPTVKPWSGPEDGLPPVGAEVELGRDCILSRFDDFKLFEKGTRVLVGGHANFGGVDVAVIHREYDSQGYTATLCQYLEPIRTPEQIAHDQRETAIRDVMDIAGTDCRVTAARLVDAGFKREVV